jgi:hypothetical protein
MAGARRVHEGWEALGTYLTGQLLSRPEAAIRALSHYGLLWHYYGPGYLFLEDVVWADQCRASAAQVPVDIGLWILWILWKVDCGLWMTMTMTMKKNRGHQKKVKRGVDEVSGHCAYE